MNASPDANTYRGPAAWSTPEASAFRGYVDGRVVGGSQQIRVHVTFHQYGRIVLYPFGWTTEPIPPDMRPADHARLVEMATEMARRSGYAAAQSSSGEIHVGNQVDWMYATHRVLSFTLEMGDSFTMPDEAIATETARNLEHRPLCNRTGWWPGPAAEHGDAPLRPGQPTRITGYDVTDISAERGGRRRQSREDANKPFPEMGLGGGRRPFAEQRVADPLGVRVARASELEARLRRRAVAGDYSL